MDVRVDKAKRILGFRDGECPPEIEKWIAATLRTMSFWDMIALSRKVIARI